MPIPILTDLKKSRASRSRGLMMVKVKCDLVDDSWKLIGGRAETSQIRAIM
jgi:hypothetical protein